MQNPQSNSQQKIYHILNYCRKWKYWTTKNYKVHSHQQITMYVTQYWAHTQLASPSTGVDPPHSGISYLAGLTQVSHWALCSRKAGCSQAESDLWLEFRTAKVTNEKEAGNWCRQAWKLQGKHHNTWKMSKHRMKAEPRKCPFSHPLIYLQFLFLKYQELSTEYILKRIW